MQLHAVTCIFNYIPLHAIISDYIILFYILWMVPVSVSLARSKGTLPKMAVMGRTKMRAWRGVGASSYSLQDSAFFIRSSASRSGAPYGSRLQLGQRACPDYHHDRDWVGDYALAYAWLQRGDWFPQHSPGSQSPGPARDPPEGDRRRPWVTRARVSSVEWLHAITWYYMMTHYMLLHGFTCM
jgi:hypothetical protein